MLEQFGLAECATPQEQITRRALAVLLLIIFLLPMPFCIWNPPGWLAYAIYIGLVSFGLQPLLTQKLKEQYLFHLFFGGVVIVAAVGAPGIVIPFGFVLVVLYLMYWQLEKRLFAIRRALKEYEYIPSTQDDLKEMTVILLKRTMKRSLIPAISFSLALAAGLIPGGGGVIFAVALIICLIVLKKQEAIFEESHRKKRNDRL